MAIPLILAIGGRVAFTVIARAIAANRARAVAKYGAKAVKEAIKIAKKTTSKDKAVVNAAKKIVKSVLPKKPQTRTKPKFVKPAKRKKITGNVKPKPKPKPKPSKLPTKPQTRKGGSKPTKAKPKAKRVPEQFKTKPMIKVIKGKPTTITSKVKQKLKPKPKLSKLPTKPQKRKGGSKPVKPIKKPVKSGGKKNPVKPKPVVKGGKLAKALPAIVGGGLLLGGLVASMRDKKKDGVKVTGRDKPQRDTKFTGKIPPKNITKSVLPKKEQKRTGGSKPTMKISSFEDRVRAMVAKKDSLKNIDAADGSGRNKYQVEMNRLKKENPKEFRKLFTMGGLGKLKD